MRSVEAGHEPHGETQRCLPGQRQREAIEALPRHELVRDVEPLLHLADAVDGNDVGMGQLGEGPRFDEEPPARLGRRVDPGDELQCHRPIERRVTREVHAPHSAPAQLPVDDELVKRGWRPAPLHRALLGPRYC